MKPQMERSDGVGPDRLGGISSLFPANEKEGLIPVSDVGWCIKMRDIYVQNAISLVFPELPN